jgi:hypothetical protein
MTRARARAASALLAALWLGVHGRIASAEPTTQGATDADQRLREAKALFQEGNALRKAGDIAGALEFYLRSRQLVPSKPNTMNVAFCLLQLERLDEVVELYEEVLTKFSGELSDADRQQISSAASALRRTLGNIDVSGDVSGMLLIDGRVRGTLPLIAPVHVRPGAHAIRVIKEGWEPFESTVTVERGQTIPVDVKLRPLAETGRLRIQSDNMTGADLWLDGAPLGELPWEGTLAVGPHLFSARRGRLGTGPTLANVVEGHTVVVAVQGVPLGQELHVLVEPPTADLWIDGIPVGKGRWRGMLPLGPHGLEARDAGYVAARVPFAVTEGAMPDIVIPLRVDEAHPRWAVKSPRRGAFRLDLLGGAALGASLGSDAESSCGRNICSRHRIVIGALVGVRGAYVLPMGLIAEIGTGFVALRGGVKRHIDETFPVGSGGGTAPVSYSLEDDLSTSGPFFTVGLGYARRVLRRITLRGTVDIGAAIVTSKDTISGTATDGGRTLDVNVAESGSPVHAAAVFVMPEIRIGFDLGPAEVALGLAGALFPLDGPRYATGQVRVVGASCSDNASAVDCAPGRNVVASERAYSSFVLFVPSVSIGHVF